MGPFDQDNELTIQRRKNFEEIAGLGFEPYPHKFDRTHTITDIVAQHGHHAGPKPPEELAQVNQELNQVNVRLAGRMMTHRMMGKAGFAHLSDGGAQLQVYVRANEVAEREWQLFKRLLDLGDIIGAEGYVFITKTGELSVHVRRLYFLAKALLPPPEKWHGLQDIEMRYRRRYLDLMVNPESRQVFVKRAQTVREIRAFFDERGYIEVETPMLAPLPTGAAARPFKTHHNALDIDLYARIAPELYLKRLTVGGFEKVYEINRNFRNEGIDRSHNPEFTMLEFYEAYSSYEDLMRLTEELLARVVERINGPLQLTYLGQEIDFSPPWPRVNMIEAIIAHWPAHWPRPMPEDLWDPVRLKSCLGAVGCAVDPQANTGQKIGKLFEHVVEEHLIQPTFIIDHPTELSPLSKQSETDPTIVHRFEMFAGGMELANAFCELNDPAEQRRRFEEQMAQRQRGDEEAMVMDEDYVRALGYGLPPTAGEGIGIDRLVMILTNQRSIRDVILFPHMRPETTAASNQEADD
jgi:lysyl-tRNA synthetase class 2